MHFPRCPAWLPNVIAWCDEVVGDDHDWVSAQETVKLNFGRYIIMYDHEPLY